MKERVLKDDEVIRAGDIAHFKDGWTHTARDGKGNWGGMKVGELLKDRGITKVTRGGEKMKERQYPKVIYRMWECANNDDLNMINSLPPKERETAGEVAIYELKEVVTVTMEPKVRKKK